MKKPEKSDSFIPSEIQERLRTIFDEQKKLNASSYDYPLVKPPFDFEEVFEAIESLMTTQVTMGEKVRIFEREFAKYIGVRHAIMVNSGSSANLLAMAILANPSIENHLTINDKVIVPALTWSTSIYPIADVGALPVFADSTLETLNLNLESVKKCITPDVKAIMAVHLIGNPCDMKGLKEICDNHGLFLIEDCCEAHGAEFNGRKVGSIGELGTYSFFFSHHISTIEGGMVVTDNDEYAELARALRAHGWTRDLKNREKIEKQYEDRDPRFLFINKGYNLRPTEIQGAFGIHQMKKLDKFVSLRRRHASIVLEELEKVNLDIDFQIEQEGGKHSWFGFPMTLRDGGWKERKRIIDTLEKQSVETRVVMGGNMGVQPARKHYEALSPVSLDVADHVDRSGILVGIHAEMSDDECFELSKRIISSVSKK
ncbi:MAG: DegT/DnrJ/EryC1/StrS family aminotransferase [Candidatus Thorarchaeota archaeon]|jgi:CDP-6-deoxy-D-xylo-4-hexulose-3-dehydrase